MNSIKRLARLTTLLLLVGLLLPTGSWPTVSAADPLSLSQVSGTSVRQGNQVTIRVKVTNPDVNTSNQVTFTASLDLTEGDGSLRLVSGDSGTKTLGGGQSVDLNFTVLARAEAEPTTWVLPLTLKDADDNVLVSKGLTLRVTEKPAPPPPEPTMPAVEISHTISATMAVPVKGDVIPAGGTATLTLRVSNVGNTVLKDTRVTLAPPEGVTIDNGSATATLGYLEASGKKSVSFNLAADAGMVAKNYPFTVTINFYDSNNAAGSVSQVLYLPVRGSASVGATDIAITSVSLPQRAPAGTSFTLGFRVENRGAGGTGNLRIYTEAPEGIVNQSQNVFSASGLAPGEGRNYSVTFSSDETIATKNYAIKIAVERAGAGEKEVPTSQYAGIYLVKGDGDGSKVKTPQLMVTTYAYGGSFVQAGSAFRLNLGLCNTSSVTVRNIKVTITAEEGTFIPVKSSNSFFIDRIGAKATVNRGLMLTAKPDAPQKTTSVTVATAYEDAAGNAFTSSDIITIPVRQDTRLVVNDIIVPPQVFPGQPTSIPVAFYNMGKTALSNVRVRAEGNFDVGDSNNYFSGNMEPGKSDTYDLAVTPRGVGELAGRLIFTYEDVSGHEQRLEKEFAMTVVEPPPPPPEDGATPPGGEKTGIPWIPIAIGVAAAGAIGFLLWRRHRKKQMHEELNIDE